jgi:hypothetical protein
MASFFLILKAGNASTPFRSVNEVDVMAAKSSLVWCRA